MVTAAAHRDPRAPAVLAPGRRALTFDELLEQIDRVRGWLHGRGFGRGDRIALIATPGPETAVATLAIASCATCVPINPRATPEECGAILDATRSTGVLALGMTDPPAREPANELGIEWLQASIPRDAPAGWLHLEGRCEESADRCNLPFPDDTALLLCTSGTTARPKIVPSEHGRLVSRAEKTRRALGLTAADRCLNVMPLCYAHGLYTGVFTPLLQGGSVIYPPAFEAESFLRCLRDLDPTWYTAGASHHQEIARWLTERPGAAAGHKLRFARSGSARLPCRVRDLLERTLSVPIVEAYATSETGLITANPPHGPRKPGTVGASPDGDVAVLDENGEVLPIGEGEVVVRGPTVFAGYENGNERGCDVFRNGWYRTGDLGYLDAEGYLTLTGRLTEIINRGGEKVSPLEVDSVLLDHPAVAEAVTFGMQDATLGEAVAAAVKLQPDSNCGARDIRRFLLSRLAPFKVPQRIVFVSELPKGPTGKTFRKGLLEHLQDVRVPSRRAETDADTRPIEKTLLGIWRDTLGRSEIGLDDDFFLLGGSSLSAVELLAGIEKELHVRLPLSSLIVSPSVREFARSLQANEDSRQPVTAESDLVGVNITGSRTPMFAVGGRDGHVFGLLGVGRMLCPEQPVYGLQPPGMKWDGVGCRTIPQMARYYIERMTTVQRHGPYRLFGFSFGGLIAFEMAIQLQAAGEKVGLLVILDSHPTSLRWDGCAYTADNQALETWERAVHRRASLRRDPIKAEGSRLARVHIAARREHIMRRRFEGELVYLYCTAYTVIPGTDHRRMWQWSATKGIRLIPLPGRHGGYSTEPQHSVLLRTLRACLEGPLPRGIDPRSVFETRYRLGRDSEGEIIHSDAGRTYRVATGAGGDRIDAMQLKSRGVVLEGRARDPDGSPATLLAVFLNGRYAGRGACGLQARGPAGPAPAGKPDYSGFWLRLPPPTNRRKPRPRVFVLAADGLAYELDARALRRIDLRHPIATARRLGAAVLRRMSLTRVASALL
ncbi:MAG: AMP-binding protein [Arenicellales bacterium]